MLLIQVSAGRGPIECSWVVSLMIKKIIKEAKANMCNIAIVDEVKDQKPKTHKSICLSIEGNNERTFVNTWLGTIQWIGKSVFRECHKRKNWFIGITELQLVDEYQHDMENVKVEAYNASGPGGQHANKTESSIRVTHKPSGIVVTSSQERSQRMNKQLALRILEQRLLDQNQLNRELLENENWQNHNELIRGNPARVFVGDKLKERTN